MSYFGSNHNQTNDTYNQHGFHNGNPDYADFSTQPHFGQKNDEEIWLPDSIPFRMSEPYYYHTASNVPLQAWSDKNEIASQTTYSMTSQFAAESGAYYQETGTGETFELSMGNAPIRMDDVSEEVSLNNLEESMASSSIAIPPSAHQAPRRRRFRSQYEPERRVEVTLTRSIGACLICRTLRVKCDTGMPCNKCIKDFESSVLAHGICSRQSLLSTRFNNIDLLRVSAYEGLIAKFGDSQVAQFVGISYSDCCGSEFVQQDFGCGNFISDFPSLPQRAECNFKNRNICPLSAGDYMTSGPVLEVFVQQHPISGHQGLTGPFSRLHKVFGDFAERCDSTPNIALKDSLVTQCLHLNRVLNKYHKASDSTFNASSSVAALQLKHRSAETAYRLEMEILYALEKRIYKSGNLQKGNPLSTWICLWLLILSYQEHMHFTKYFNHDDVRVAKPLHELSKHMFNGLTTVYATFFKDSNPMSEDWTAYSISEELGHDQDLMASFLKIKSEIRTFYSEKDGLSEHDVLFKILVVDAESKLLALEPW